MEEELFGIIREKKDTNFHVLVIYDISDTKQRNQLVKFLNGFGYRVQKSAFEAILPQKKYLKLVNGLKKYAKAPDSIRVYKWNKKAKMIQFGKNITINEEKIVIV